MVKCGRLALGAAGAAALAQTGCSYDGLAPLTNIKIVEDACIGCGECLDYCYYDALALPEKTRYFIDEENCVECAECIELCQYEAIEISQRTYEIDEGDCVGCGDCIDVCVNEGNCIVYEKEDYTVRGKCKPNRCRLECAANCPEEAITITYSAEIDLEKCTRCGDCVDACPFGAINPAKATIIQEDCIRCGKCEPVCEFDAIESRKPDGYKPPKILLEVCASCGDCVSEKYCPDYDAIDREIKIVELIEDKCKECVNCMNACRFEAIVRE